LNSVLNEVAPEKNAIVDKFSPLEWGAFETALLQLKNEYCSKGRCLECAIGIELMKRYLILICFNFKIINLYL
jgi:hypothetical protein